jgi:hypothetical protein
MAAHTVPAWIRLGRPPILRSVNHYISGEPVTFFLIVAGIERGALLGPRAWGMGRSVDNGTVLFS